MLFIVYCTPTWLKNKQLPQADMIKNLGVYLNQLHLNKNKKIYGLKLNPSCWIVERRYQLNLITYATILKCAKCKCPTKLFVVIPLLREVISNNLKVVSKNVVQNNLKDYTHSNN